MELIQILLVTCVAFIAGMEGILDQFQFHQPLVACTLIGLFTNHLQEGIILGGALQMIALGWANIGASVAPDAALASVISAILMVHARSYLAVSATTAINLSIVIAIPLSVIGLYLTGVVRKKSVDIVHQMDIAANKADFKKIELLQYKALAMQGLRIAIPAFILCILPSSLIAQIYMDIPSMVLHGIALAVGLISSVGFAIVINVISGKNLWPFFIIGFVFATIQQLSLVALSCIAIALAIIVITFKPNQFSSNTLQSDLKKSTEDPLDEILNDYE